MIGDYPKTLPKNAWQSAAWGVDEPMTLTSKTLNTNDILTTSDGKHANKVSMADMAAAMWDAMYLHSAKVVVSCRYCASHNAISNAVCVRCGAPMGKSE